MLKLTENLSLDRYDYALQSLRNVGARLPSKVVFDIGPGNGSMQRIEQDSFEWQGFDREAWGDVKQWDIAEPGYVPEQRAGGILLLDVIEHVPNPGLALRNISAALLDDGYLVITVPNPSWSGSRIHALFRGYASGFTPLDLEENHHVFIPWPHVLERLLSDAGFQIEEYVTLDGSTTLFRAEGTMFKPLRYLMNLGMILIEHFDPTACGMSLGLLARKKCEAATQSPYPGSQKGTEFTPESPSWTPPSET